jgi:alpha-tubulin suppressor-like RCC1 family protein
VQVLVGDLALNGTRDVSITATVIAPVGTVLNLSASTFSVFTQDPIGSNNSATANVPIIDPDLFLNSTSLATLVNHTLALRAGTVWTWGNNTDGGLGDGTTVTRTLPHQVDDLMFVTAIAAGRNFSLALKSDGTVWSWGTNASGVLGIGSRIVTNITRPARVAGLTNVVKIAAGVRHALALKSDGTVWGWGGNENHQVGQGAIVEATPRQVPNLSGIVEIFAGDNDSFAIRNDQTVFAWGQNINGELGNGLPTIQSTPIPIQIDALNGTVKIAAGLGFTLALKNDNTVWSWGSNLRGRLGRGLPDSDVHPIPTQIPNLLAADITAFGHAVIRKADGTIVTFGANLTGELGLGTKDSDPHPTPVSVNSISSVVTAHVSGSSGDGTSFVRINDGINGLIIKSWGNGPHLGNGSALSSVVPGAIAEEPIVAKPLLSVSSGAVNPAALVTVVCGTPNAIVHYTTNGQEPTQLDPVVTSNTPIQINQNLTLKTKAWRNGFTPSETSSATYLVSSTPNLIDDARLFVRQQYIDFLGREPDQSGWDFWTNQITSCGSDQQCIEVKRINVSAAFFLSIEFQETGYLVERMYKATFGDATGTSTFGGTHQLPVPFVSRTDLMLDRAKIGLGVIVGQPGWEALLANNKTQFYDEWVQRRNSVFPFDPLPAAILVDTLNTNAGSPLTQAERDTLVTGMQNFSISRAQVLRTIVEHPRFVASESNRAFVLMQFIGYLQRNPHHPPDSDYTGFDFWLTKLNQFNGNFVNAEMVKAFIVSGEYRQRFGP